VDEEESMLIKTWVPKILLSTKKSRSRIKWRLKNQNWKALKYWQTRSGEEETKEPEPEIKSEVKVSAEVKQPGPKSS